MKSTCVCNSAQTGLSVLTTKFQQARKVFGLAIAAIGLSASIVSADTTITVQDPSFETPGASPGGPWAAIDAVWNSNIGFWAQTYDNARFATRTDTGTWYANLTDAGEYRINQNLATTVNSGDTLAVTFYVGRENGQVGGIMAATFLVGTTPYTQNFDTTGLTQGTWQSYTLTKTIGNSGNLSLKFQRVSGRPWLDNISNVTVTSAPPPNGEPTSTSATLTAVEDTETALAAADFGYADPNTPPSPLKAVRITSLPLLGTLKLSGTPVVNGDLPLTVLAANIGTLTYLAATNANGAAYTMIGIKVESENNLWSLADGVMTVNVTAVNDAPTSTGGSVVLNTNTIKTFASADFPFADVDAGDTFGAIKVVTSLPANGTLKLNGTDITAVPSAAIPVANIGTLTYTPNSGYNGADSFKFQVRDASLFSADATMAISVTSDIIVQNGSFENPNVGSWWTNTGAPWTDNCGGYGRVPASVNSVPSAPGGGVWIANMNDAPNPGNNWPGNIITQPLGAQTLKAGDTLQMTLYLYRTSISGVLRVSFLDGATTLASQDIDTSTQTANTWKLYTFSQTILTGVTANLQLKFQNVGGKVSWLDMVSNVSVIPAPPRGTVIILW